MPCASVARRRVHRQLGEGLMRSESDIISPLSTEGAVHRGELLRRIVDRIRCGVVLLQAPAGHGKTTLMQQLRAHWHSEGIITDWLSVDESDNDASRLFAQLQAMLQRLEILDTTAHSGMKAGPNLTPRRAPRFEWFIDRLTQLESRVVIFLDEFQLLHNRSILGFFKGLLERLPENAIFVIGSRRVPDIGLARLTVNGQALVLRSQDLRFSLSESEYFFSRSAGPDLTRKELASIYERSEGWPAALQLYRLSLASPSVRQSLSDISDFRPRELAEYLADNVIDLQPEPLKKFLRATALLKRVCGPVCDAVTGRQDSQTMLLQLERAGLFLRCLDAEDYWFKYHTLFSDFLARQFKEQDPERAEQVHLDAANWFDSHGHHESAVHHAIAAGDPGLASGILDKGAGRLIMDGNLTTLERLSDQLPVEVIAERPSLTVKVAYALAFLRRRQKLLPIQAILEKFSHSSDQSLVDCVAVIRAMVLIIQDDIAGASKIINAVCLDDAHAQGFRAFELGAGANLHGFLSIAEGNPESAREFLALGRALSERAGAVFSWGYAVSTAGVNLLLQGYLQEAIEKFRQGMLDPRISLDESVASAVLVACHIYALYEADLLDEARAQFEQYRAVIRNAALLDYTTLAYVALARIHDASGESALAQELLEELEAIAYASDWPRMRRSVHWERVRRAFARGEADRARSIASRMRVESHDVEARWIPFSEDTEGDVIGGIRLAIADGRLEEALEASGSALAEAEKLQRARRQIKLRLLEAIALRALGKKQAALAMMSRALELAAPGGFIRIFIEEGESALALLREVGECRVAQAHSRPANRGRRASLSALDLCHAILGAAGIKDKTTSALEGEAFKPLEPLSERELQVLSSVAQGASNKAAASELFLSENTVKFHLKNIYSKLAVSGRAQAIHAAHQMGLI